MGLPLRFWGASADARLVQVSTNAQTKIGRLLHSLLKKIQEWIAVIWPDPMVSSFLQIEPAFCAGELGKNRQWAKLHRFRDVRDRSG
jgi:hypothetical protein